VNLLLSKSISQGPGSAQHRREYRGSSAAAFTPTVSQSGLAVNAWWYFFFKKGSSLALGTAMPGDASLDVFPSHCGHRQPEGTIH